jgi:hypothetical protein
VPKLTTAINARTESTKKTVQTERDRASPCSWLTSCDGSMGAKTRIGNWQPGLKHALAHD